MLRRSALSLMILAPLAVPALAQTNFPGRMPGDVPYAHEYGANRPFQPYAVPPPPPPVFVPTRPPEQATGYQPLRPAPPSDVRIPEPRAVPERNGLRGSGRLIEVPGPQIRAR